jgi:hypothetical protein
MIRYVMARYGYASNIAAWELCNEADLVTDYKARKPQILAWHRRIAKVIRQFDQQPHLITTNFAIWDHEQSILSMPEISFSSTNHYHVKIIDRMRQAIYPNKKRFHKPAIMAECGYDFKGAKPDTTERYLHICLWGSYMMPFAGTGLSWWWDFIDDRDLYHMFRPVAEFAEGEDRRGRNLRMSDGTLYTSTGQTIGALKGITLQNDRSAYFWVYEGRLLRAESASDLYPEARKGVFIQLRRLKDGPYRVEFWDTHKGGLIKVLSATAESGILKCALPTFASDIAGKVKPVSPDTLDAVSKPAMTPEG